MELEVAVKGMLDAQKELRVRGTVDNPELISKQMFRLAQYTVGVENNLAELEEEYETREGTILSDKMLTEGKSATAAEKYVKMELGVLEGQLKYLSRITQASWRLHGDLQSRVKHVNDQMQGGV